MVQRIALALVLVGSPIGLVLPAYAQSTQSEDLQVSVQDQQRSSNEPYSDGQLSGLANQINETAAPTIDLNAPGVYRVADGEGFPNNLVIIESGLDTSSPADLFGKYAIGVSF